MKNTSFKTILISCSLLTTLALTACAPRDEKTEIPKPKTLKPAQTGPYAPRPVPKQDYTKQAADFALYSADHVYELSRVLNKVIKVDAEGLPKCMTVEKVRDEALAKTVELNLERCTVNDNVAKANIRTHGTWLAEIEYMDRTASGQEPLLKYIKLQSMNLNSHFTSDKERGSFAHQKENKVAILSLKDEQSLTYRMKYNVTVDVEQRRTSYTDLSLINVRLDGDVVMDTEGRIVEVKELAVPMVFENNRVAGSKKSFASFSLDVDAKDLVTLRSEDCFTPRGTLSYEYRPSERPVQGQVEFDPTSPTVTDEGQTKCALRPEVKLNRIFLK